MTCFMTCTEFFRLVLPSLVSFIIMIITLKFQDRQFKITTQNQIDKFEISYSAQEKHYLKNERIMQEQQRISIMPYLILEKTEISKQGNYTYFDVYLKNIGNNIATDIFINTHKDSYHNPNCIKIEGCKKYIISSPLSNNILQTNSYANFGIALICNTEDKIEQTFENTGQLNFSVTFSDIQNNEYTQEFSFKYNIENNKYPIVCQGTCRPKFKKQNYK